MSGFQVTVPVSKQVLEKPISFLVSPMMYAPHVSLDQAGKSPPSPCPHVVLSQDCEACGESNSGLLILEKLVSKRPDHLL